MKFLKALTIFYLLVATCNCSWAQDTTGGFAHIFNKIKIVEGATTALMPVVDCKVGAIIIKDNRPDTDCIGLYDDNKRMAIKLVFNNSGDLGSIFNKYLVADTATTKLYIVINHFFISNKLVNGLIKKTYGIVEGGHKWYYAGQLTYQAKIYVSRGDNYRGLVKIDTVITSKKYVESSFADLLAQALSITSTLIKNSMDDGRYMRHPELSALLIDSINQPIKLDEVIDSAYGYYNTYDDFKNNILTPAIFEMATISRGCYALYTKSKDGTPVLERSIWGVKRGYQLYIMDDDLIYPIYKKDNGYYWNSAFELNIGDIKLSLYTLPVIMVSPMTFVKY